MDILMIRKSFARAWADGGLLYTLFETALSSAETLHCYQLGSLVLVCWLREHEAELHNTDLLGLNR